MANLLARSGCPRVARGGAGREVARGAAAVPGHAARGPGLPAAEHRLPRGRDRIFPGKRRARRGGVFQQEPRWVQRAADKAGCAHVTLDDDRSGTLLDAAGGLSAFRDRGAAEDDLAAILYTSGTTGRKGAMLSHGNLASNARVLHQYWGWRADDVLLHMLPIFHVHGLFVASHGALLAGARDLAAQARHRAGAALFAAQHGDDGRADLLRAPAGRCALRPQGLRQDAPLHLRLRAAAGRDLRRFQAAQRPRDPGALA